MASYNYPKIYKNAYGKVSVYKNIPKDPNRNPSYTVIWQEARGKQARKRKTRSDEEEAHQLARTILDEMTKGAEIRPDISAAKMAEFVRAEELLREHCPGGETLEDVVKHYLEHREPISVTPASTSPAPVRYALGTLVFQYLESLEVDKSKAHVAVTRSILNAFSDDLGAGSDITEISPLQIDEWLNQTENQNTRASRQRSVRAFFNWMRRKEFLPDQNTAADKSNTVLPLPKEPGTLPPHDLEKLLTACLEAGKKEAVRYLAIGAFAGVRKAEMLRLTWANIISGNIILNAEITKTNRRRLIPIRDNLSLWLEAAGGRADFNAPVCQINDITRHLNGILTDLGIEWVDNCLRHGFVTYSIAKGDAASLIAEQAGHTEQELQTSYKCLATPEEGEEWFNIKPPTGYIQIQNKNVTPWQAGLPAR